MSRIAVCLFFIAILHNGIVKVATAQENVTTTESVSKAGAEEEAVTTKPTVVEKTQVEDEVPLKILVEPEAKSGEPAKTEPKVQEVTSTKDVTEKKADAPNEGEVSKDSEPKKEGDFTTGDRVFTMFSGSPIKKGAHFFLQIPKTAGGTIGQAIAKTIDTAKTFATGTLGFLRSSVDTVF